MRTELRRRSIAGGLLLAGFGLIVIKAAPPPGVQAGFIIGLLSIVIGSITVFTGIFWD